MWNFQVFEAVRDFILLFVHPMEIAARKKREVVMLGSLLLAIDHSQAFQHVTRGIPETGVHLPASRKDAQPTI